MIYPEIIAFNVQGESVSAHVCVCVYVCVFSGIGQFNKYASIKCTLENGQVTKINQSKIILYLTYRDNRNKSSFRLRKCRDDLIKL